jgi:hypothetical protein
MASHRHCERSEAIHSLRRGGMDCFVALLPCANASRLSQAMTSSCRHAGPTMRNYLIFSYAAPKSASGIGIVIVSLAIFWNETFNCLPDFNVASTSGEICRLA